MTVFNRQSVRGVRYLARIAFAIILMAIPYAYLHAEEKALAQPLVQAEQIQATGPLRVNPTNPRYFTDGSGKAILLVGSHTWQDFQAFGAGNPPPDTFDYPGYLNFLKANNLNLLRLWGWEESRGPAGYPANYLVSPMLYLRPGPGTATDGLPKFDVSQFDQAYFDRMRQHVIAAGNQGIYVDIQLFNGWSVGSKAGGPNPWPNHPLNSNNNVNGINGDTNGDGNGYEVETLSHPSITALQDAYVRKVIDTVNDLDNVLYEICNETETGTAYVAWQNHMIDLTHAYEATKPKQHVVGFSVPYSSSSSNSGNNSWIFNSNADWVAPNEYDSSGYNYKDNPRPNAGSKVIIADTDHLWGLGGDRAWVWKSFTRGLNVSYMDCYVADSLGCPISQADPTRLSLLANMGYALNYANRMSLVAMTPRGDLCSTGFCLANPAATNAEYLVYLPSGGTVNVNLSASPGSLSVEWFNPSTGAATSDGTIVGGGATRSFTPPFSGDAVLYLLGALSAPETPTATATPSSTATTLPPAATATRTVTALPPTATATRTATALPPTATPTPVSDVIFSDGFESGSFSAWSATGGNAARVSVTSGGAQSTSTRKMQARIGGGASGYAQDNTPTSGTLYHARFYLNPNGLTTGIGSNPTAIDLVDGLNASNGVIFRAQYRRSSSTGYQVRLTVARAGGTTSTSWYPIMNNAWNALEIVWQSANPASASLYTAGVLRQTLTGLNTSASTLEAVRLGPQGSLGGISGTAYFDNFASTRLTTIGP